MDRINEVIELLEQFALGEIDLPADRLAVALRLLDWEIGDAPPDGDGGDELLELADERVVLAFSQKFAA